jgi:hypothetical protein
VVWVWVKGKSKIIPLTLSTVAISTARLGVGLWSELGKCNVRHMGVLDWDRAKVKPLAL